MNYEFGLYVFMLSAFLGFELIRKVSPLLHTPLMSLTNAISSISVVGAIMISGEKDASTLSRVLGFVAVVSATTNLVSGYLITDRMLKMFKSTRDQDQRRFPVVPVAIAALAWRADLISAWRRDHPNGRVGPNA